jgi:hypothetical protein
MEFLIVSILIVMFLGAVSEFFTSITPEEYRKGKNDVD